MRSANTYRAARRNDARNRATAKGASFSLTWLNGGFRQLPKTKKNGRPVERYEPVQATGKRYAPNGKQERARRLRQIGLLILEQAA